MPKTRRNYRLKGRLKESDANSHKLGIYLPTNNPQLAIDFVSS